ncbi:MAG: TonB-dependent receptor [Sulfurimonas sp. GWF2_37_8]|nr:MAG: TonB-dependent receptor [Sulfurimonas sp. GWF2_37_8]
MKKSFVALSVMTSVLLAESFTLGQVSVLENNEESNLFEQSISPEEIAQNSSDTVSEALDNMSGVNQDVQGGRGESTLYVRGFDAKRVGVFIDGIPIYVPYDGNFDYGRFLTSDIGSIDVSKGYSSVVYGANTMGGVVNIVSRKPTKEFEGNVKGKIVLDSEAKMARHVESVNVGTKQGNFYGQLGANYSKQDHFRISDDYDATPTQPEGERLRSEAQDKKISLKAGVVAEDKSEVAISYVNQKGVKQQPPVTDTSFAKNKDWDWPYWDKETFSVTGQKNFENSYLKALAYYDKSKNSLYSYDDNTFETLTKKWAFKSRYDDYSYGARIENGVELGGNFLKAAANYKKDVHQGYDMSKTTDEETLTEKYEDHTISVGLEDTYTFSSQWEILGGVSYDTRVADKIFDTNTANLDMLALEAQSSLSPQAALVFSPDETSQVKASVSRKTYMPSMKDRYSRKFNTYVPNVDLENEISTHYELSYQKQINAFITRTNLFYTKVDDAIQSVVWDQNSSLFQNQNVGTFDHKGIEFELSYKHDGLKTGANYTYLDVKNTKDSDIKIVDVPKNQIFAFAQQEIGTGFSFYANAKYRNGAYENKLDGTYVTNPDFTTFDLKAIYEPTKALTAEIGVKNLTDELVRYDMAYPMAGREFFASLEYKF